MQFISIFDPLCRFYYDICELTYQDVEFNIYTKGSSNFCCIQSGPIIGQRYMIIFINTPDNSGRISEFWYKDDRRLIGVANIQFTVNQGLTFYWTTL